MKEFKSTTIILIAGTQQKMIQNLRNSTRAISEVSILVDTLRHDDDLKTINFGHF